MCAPPLPPPQPPRSFGRQTQRSPAATEGKRQNALVCATSKLGPSVRACVARHTGLALRERPSVCRWSHTLWPASAARHKAPLTGMKYASRRRRRRRCFGSLAQRARSLQADFAILFPRSLLLAAAPLPLPLLSSASLLLARSLLLR